MRKYRGLTDFLRNFEGDEITLSFSKINELTGESLPPSAYRHRPWWANRSDGSGSQNRAWQSVGFEAGYVNVDKEEVQFFRVAKPLSESSAKAVTSAPDGDNPLTIAQAKAGLSKMFGVPVEAIDINIRG